MIQIESSEPTHFAFHRDDTEIGRLWLYKDGRMSFEGNADESAQVFMNMVIARYTRHMQELHAEIDRLRARVEVLDCIAHEACMLLKALEPVHGLVALRIADVANLLHRLEEVDDAAAE